MERLLNSNAARKANFARTARGTGHTVSDQYGDDNCPTHTSHRGGCRRYHRLGRMRCGRDAFVQSGNDRYRLARSARPPMATAEGNAIRVRSGNLDLLGPVRGHNMATGAVEAAIWEAEARQKNVSLAQLWRGVRDEVSCGVSVGMKVAL